MSVTSPTAITALPTPPSTASPADFDSRADSFLGALPTFTTQSNSLATVNYNNAVDCQTNAGLAQTAASNAASAAATAVAASGAAAWVSGTTYSVGAAVYSPVNRLIYRRLIAGAGTTDPSADGTNWIGIDTSLSVIVVTGTTQAAAAGSHYVLTNVSATTVTLPASPATGDQVWVTVANDLTTNVIAKNAKTIMKLAQDLTINVANVTVKLRYVNTDWKLV